MLFEMTPCMQIWSMLLSYKQIWPSDQSVLDFALIAA